VTVPTQRYIEAAAASGDEAVMLAVRTFLEQQGLGDITAAGQQPPQPCAHPAAALSSPISPAAAAAAYRRAHRAVPSVQQPPPRQCDQRTLVHLPPRPCRPSERDRVRRPLRSV
jgi:hypothetical protein